jgi:ATP-dependent DNA helicase RecQ
MANPAANFRDGQFEVIHHLVDRRGKVLCVQRTGWGKSMVYFVAAKLMRAMTINSTNQPHWGAARKSLLADEVDLLLISPERLANDDFVANTDRIAA